MSRPTHSMMSHSAFQTLRDVLIVFFLVTGFATGAGAFSTLTVGEYLLVGRGNKDTAVGVKVSDGRLGELGTVPSGSVPDVNDNPPWPLPSGAVAPVSGRTSDGNIAVTNSKGNYDLANIDIYADIGIRCVKNVTGNCRESFSGSTLHSGTFANDATAMSNIELELDAAEIEIAGLVSTTGWTLSGDGSKTGSGNWRLPSSGEVDSDTVITLAPGLNVIVIDPRGNDMKINNAGLVIDGPANSSVIFKKSGDKGKNFLFSNASITKGNGGISDNAILFAETRGENGSNFDFSKVIVNGVSFWDLSDSGGEITMNNVQGCGQWVGDHLNFNDVQLSRCAVVPEPSTALLMAFGLMGLAISSQRPLTRSRAMNAKRSI